jgi:AcrR family transcriptional regulator
LKNVASVFNNLIIITHGSTGNMAKVRIPKQARAVHTRQRIIKAGLQEFSQKGIHDANTSGIARRARVSVGTFYLYFKNKRTLLLEILEDFLDQVFSTVWKGINQQASIDLDKEGLRSIIENVFEAYAIAPEFLRQSHALRYSDPDIKQRYDREREREITQISQFLESDIGRFNISDTYAAAIIIHNAVESVAHTAMFLGPSVEKDRLVDELTHMLHSYLLHR